MLLANNIRVTYPHSIGNVDGTTSIKATQSSLCIHSKTALYSINTVIATNDNEHTDAQFAILFFFIIIIHAIIQNTILTTKHKSINAPTNVIFIYASTLNKNFYKTIAKVTSQDSYNLLSPYFTQISFVFSANSLIKHTYNVHKGHIFTYHQDYAVTFYPFFKSIVDASILKNYGIYSICIYIIIS